MARLIRTDIRHISDAANNADSFRVLRGRVSALKIAPDAQFMPYLELAEFGWTTRPGIGKSSDVPIYRLRIEQHAREGLREAAFTWSAIDCNPLYVQQVWGSDAVSALDAEPMAYYSPQQAEPEQDPQPDPGQSQLNMDSHGYRPDSMGGEYYPSFTQGEYAYDFELFGSPRSQYGMPGPSDTYPQHYRTHDGSSSSAANEQHDLSSTFSTPPPADDEDVSRRPGRERRPPRRYTLRKTPSNHQI
ncbi:hypothetical protein GOBAR_DD12630 [Gossypium barbadense]|nr:hypothetical protein GOBAR_DD12630 [Gossypium barbadense]